MIWYKYQRYDDEKTFIGYRLFASAENAIKWEANENADHYTTTILGPAKQEEVLKFIEDSELKVDSATLSAINNKSYYLNN